MSKAKRIRVYSFLSGRAAERYRRELGIIRSASFTLPTGTAERCERAAKLYSYLQARLSRV